MEIYIEQEEQQIKLTARKTSDNAKVYACDVKKRDGPFYCDETYEELIVRKCVEKRDHFAYKSRLSPVGSLESKLHKDCKNEICEALKLLFTNGRWEVERPLKDNSLRPDISGYISNKPVAIEVQASAYKIDKIIERTLEYNNKGIHITWIIPLKEELGDENFRPRLFERFLHTMFYGRVYYWVKGFG